MVFRRRKSFLSVLIDSGLGVLASMRDRVPDDVGDLSAGVKDTYETASDRVSRAAGALRGEEDSHILGTITTLVIGVGIGVGIGLLIAPNTGEETRADLAEMAAGWKDKYSEATEKKASKNKTESGEQ
jgi:hypothetical protein